jgi:hypothetical protein
MRPDPDSPQEVGRFVTEVEAMLVVHHLADEGIRACVAGTGSATGWTEDPGNVQVLVRAADLERARQIVDRVRVG